MNIDGPYWTGSEYNEIYTIKGTTHIQAEVGTKDDQKSYNILYPTSFLQQTQNLLLTHFFVGE